MSDVHTRLGGRVRDLRTRRGWTQETLGERAGLSYKFIGEIERGLENPTIDSVDQIAHALSIDIGELMRRDASDVSYATVSADDFAILREARQSLSSVEDVFKRFGTTNPLKPRKRAKGR